MVPSAMLDRLLVAALSLSLQAPTAGPAAPAGPGAAAHSEPAPEPREGFAVPDDAPPPPGSPEELALWKAGRDATLAILGARTEALQLRARIKGANLMGRLWAVAKESPHEAAERLMALHRRLVRAWDRSVDLYKRVWPVDPTRGCGYPHLFYDTAMRLAPGPSRQAEVSNTSEDLRACVARAGLVIDTVRASNEELSGLRAEAEKALARAEAAVRHERAEGARHEAHERHEKGEGKEREAREKE